MPQTLTTAFVGENHLKVDDGKDGTTEKEIKPIVTGVPVEKIFEIDAKAKEAQDKEIKAQSSKGKTTTAKRKSVKKKVNAKA